MNHVPRICRTTTILIWFNNVPNDDIFPPTPIRQNETDSDEELEYDPSMYPQRVGRQKHLLDIEFHFNDGRRGGLNSRKGPGGPGGPRQGGDRPSGGDRAGRPVGGGGAGFPGGRPPRRDQQPRSEQQQQQDAAAVAPAAAAPAAAATPVAVEASVAAAPVAAAAVAAPAPQVSFGGDEQQQQQRPERKPRAPRNDEHQQRRRPAYVSVFGWLHTHRLIVWAICGSQILQRK